MDAPLRSARSEIRVEQLHSLEFAGEVPMAPLVVCEARCTGKLNSQLRSVAVGCTLSGGRKLKTAISTREREGGLYV